MEREKKIVSSNIKRKYYEEIIEEKREKQREIANVAYKNNLREFRKLTKTLNDAKIHKQSGPLWYQELSTDQMMIFRELENLIKKDFVHKSTKRVRCALSTIGIKTKIPEVVVKNAILSSKYNTIDFLKKIEEYLNEQKNKVLKKSTKLTKYTFEERLVVSGILYLGLPSLFMKLDYCLSDPVPEKQQRYINLKKNPSKKYFSPYLEPINAPEEPWYENENIKLHNLNAKKQKRRQKLRENIITNKQITQEHSIIHNMEQQMKFNKQMHSLEAMSFKLSMDNISENLTNEKPQTDKNDLKLYTSKMSCKFNKSKKIGNCVFSLVSENKIPSTVNENTANTNVLQTNDKNDKKVAMADENINSFTSCSNCSRNEYENDFPITISSVVSNLTNSSGQMSNFWKYLNTAQYEQSENTMFHQFEYENVDEESEPEETVEGEDFSFLIDEGIDDEGEKEPDEHVTSKNIFVQNSVENDPVFDRFPIVLPYEIEIHEKSFLEIYKKFPLSYLMETQSEIEKILIRMFNKKTNMFPDYQLHFLGVKSTIQNEEKQKINFISTNEEKVANHSSQPMNDTPKSTVALDSDKRNVTISNTNSGDNFLTLHKPEQSVMNEEVVDQVQVSQKEKTHIFDEALEHIRKLPKFVELEEALKFLAILGDPVARLPNLTDLKEIKYWYKRRINVNKRRLIMN